MSQSDTTVKESLKCEQCGMNTNHYLAGWNELNLAVYQCDTCGNRRRGPTF